jgi:hypothetical protein
MPHTVRRGTRTLSLHNEGHGLVTVGHRSCVIGVGLLVLHDTPDYDFVLLPGQLQPRILERQSWKHGYEVCIMQAVVFRLADLPGMDGIQPAT